MKKKQKVGMSANCCLVPLLVFVALACVVAFGISAVSLGHIGRFFQSVAKDEGTSAFNEGRNYGRKLGTGFAVNGDQVPHSWELDALAEHKAHQHHVRHDQAQWVKGFKAGFAQGYKEASKPAFQ